jgi:hypothetical protein
MFSKIFAAAALAVVSAADVPLFSSNDDYDEINLNIRMLSNGTSAAAVETTIAAAVKVEAAFPQITIGGQTVNPTAALLNDLASFKAGCKAALETTTALTGSTVTVTGVTDAARRARARALTTTQLSLNIAYNAVFATAALADTAVAAIAEGSNGATTFASDLGSGLKTNLVSQGFMTQAQADAITFAVTSKGGSVQTGGAAAAAPSPSPSSNAAKVAVSTLAAFAAFMASMM